jgi:hypothetical protein
MQSSCQQKPCHFLGIFLEAACSQLSVLRIEGAHEHLKNFSWSSPIFPLFTHTTFSQSKSRVTVPLNNAVE